MNSKLLFPLAGCLALAGCATGLKTDVYTYRNDMGGPGIDFIVDNELYSGEKPSELVWLNASRIRQGAWDAQYYLKCATKPCRRRATSRSGSARRWR